jgi:predicted lipid carrier protein YhbT
MEAKAMATPNALSESHRAALERLLRIAQSDTGQSRRVAAFLLAWWNAEQCGGFDLTDLWGVDSAIAADMVTVFALVAGRHSYPDTLGYSRQFQAIVEAWRPRLTEG